MSAPALLLLFVATSHRCAHAQEPSTADAISAARAGGVVLVFRHAITDDFREREPVDYADPSTQRKLDERGETQSRAIGRALDRLGVQVVDVVASPMHRARTTARLITGRDPGIEPMWHTNGGSYGGRPREARRAFLSRPVEAGTVLVVSHIGTMESVLDGIRGRVGEGDCVVVRPGDGGYRVVGIVPWEAWGTHLDGAT